jgi:hypothetical protein
MKKERKSKVPEAVPGAVHNKVDQILQSGEKTRIRRLMDAIAEDIAPHTVQIRPKKF